MSRPSRSACISTLPIIGAAKFAARGSQLGDKQAASIDMADVGESTGQRPFNAASRAS
jgi:hypothetical protein